MMKNYRKEGRFKGNKSIEEKIIGLRLPAAKEIYDTIRVVVGDGVDLSKLKTQTEKLNKVKDNSEKEDLNNDSSKKLNPKRINVELKNGIIVKVIKWG